MESHEPGKENNENYIGTRVERNPLGTTQGGKFIMRIQHNISALNSYRQLNGNNNGLSKNLEKLSSGYRINRAGDDAAGLAISEKMRAQIRGLETAQKNSQDGISLVQTAEGALTEVHSMLNRMVELATQSSNGTFDDKVDRANLQKEVQSLKDEIDRISEATNFNGINLLDGSMGGGSQPITNLTGDNLEASTAVKAKYSTTAAPATTAAGDPKTFEIEFTDGTKITVDYVDSGSAAGNGALIADALNKNSEFNGTFKATAAADGKLTVEGLEDGATKIVKSLGGLTLDATNNKMGMGAGEGLKVKNAFADGQKYTLDGVQYTIKTGATIDASKNEISINDFKKKLEEAGFEFRTDKGAAGAATTAAGEYIVRKDIGKGGGLELQIGDTNDKFQKLSVSVGDMSIKGLGLSSVDIGKQATAADAIKAIKEAINTVSSARGNLGAVQNRLEHTIENLGVTTENMSAAEARIRDTDMAKEMMGYTKNSILVQASQAMLAQANQVPQGVLQLLQ